MSIETNNTNTYYNTSLHDRILNAKKIKLNIDKSNADCNIEDALTKLCILYTIGSLELAEYNLQFSYRYKVLIASSIALMLCSLFQNIINDLNLFYIILYIR